MTSWARVTFPPDTAQEPAGSRAIRMLMRGCRCRWYWWCWRCWRCWRLACCDFNCFYNFNTFSGVMPQKGAASKRVTQTPMMHAYWITCMLGSSHQCCDIINIVTECMLGSSQRVWDQSHPRAKPDHPNPIAILSTDSMLSGVTNTPCFATSVYTVAATQPGVVVVVVAQSA